MKLRIVSDGTLHGTSVTDELGNAIEDVIEVSFCYRIRGLPTATITILDTEADLAIEDGMIVTVGTEACHEG